MEVWAKRMEWFSKQLSENRNPSRQIEQPLELFDMEFKAAPKIVPAMPPFGFSIILPLKFAREAQLERTAKVVDSAEPDHRLGEP